MNKILIVEDSNMFANLLKKRVADDFKLECVIKTSYQEAVALLADSPDDFLLATLDLTLPGSPDGEIVDLVVNKGIPAVVVTGRMDDQTREKILGKQILDYIMKGPHTLDLLSTTIRRFIRNQEVTVLVVEDSNLVRENTRRILATQHFNVIEANNGVEAIEQLKANPATKLVLTDYNMPQMDGFELTAAIRKSFSMDDMAIIGMSAHDNPLLSAQFLKRGANDFINKPYFEEELVWRVNQNIEMLDRIAQLREASIRDPLTGLYNRRYFFQVGAKLFKSALQKKRPTCVAMLAIDDFQAISNSYGHACSDLVLAEIAATLQANFDAADLIAHLGGEKFVVISNDADSDTATEHFETMREKISEMIIQHEGHIIEPSVSIGVTTSLEETLDLTIRAADDLLYQAKESGQNCVVVH